LQRYYIATDERTGNATTAILAQRGAITALDLLTMSDRRAYGWPLLFTDLLGIVEQVLLMHAHYFYGHGLSSFAGGVVNFRAVAGMDPSTAYLD
jgi:hypothetical protein